ncbi:hypothetical protein Rsph17029_0085 [Rhodobacter sphaeroides ATCC 17029]|nr:hypothetical protein Rsph17029_0085 [Cereibacter sphaeroides ATCC 17029]
MGRIVVGARSGIRRPHSPAFEIRQHVAERGISVGGRPSGTSLPHHANSRPVEIAAGRGFPFGLGRPALFRPLRRVSPARSGGLSVRDARSDRGLLPVAAPCPASRGGGRQRGRGGHAARSTVLSGASDPRNAAS